MLNFDNLKLRYEPYPIGLAKTVFPPNMYDLLVEEFPPKELFKSTGYGLAVKLSLSEKHNATSYIDFIQKHRLWAEIYSYVKSVKFVDDIVTALKANNIDIGLKGKVSTRFEFSAISANGGLLAPHTDMPSKIITVILSMCKEGEWAREWGGGTDVVRPIDQTQNFNWVNRYLKFEEVEKLDSYAYAPNQAVVFVKTFNSWHSVGPLTGPEGHLRKTLTLNIEKIDG